MTQRGRWARSWAVGDRGAHNLLPSGVPAGVIGCGDPRPAGVSGASILASRSGFRFGGQSVGSLVENTVVAGGQARPWAGTEYVGDAPGDRGPMGLAARDRAVSHPALALGHHRRAHRPGTATTAPGIANTAPGTPPPPREPLPSPGNPATLPGNRRHRLGTAAARREPPPPPPPPRERPTTRNVATAPVPAGAGPIGDYLRPRALERKFVDFFRGSGLWSVSRLRSLLDEFSATVASSA